MLTKGAASALVQVSSVAGQVINFAAGDSLNLNQNQASAADGTAQELARQRAEGTRSTRPPTAGAPCAPLPARCDFVTTVASKIRMITYYIDNVTDPQRPRLVRRMNNGLWNTSTTCPARRSLSISKGCRSLTTWWTASTTRRTCGWTTRISLAAVRSAPTSCFPNQIRKVNIMLSARSRLPRRGTQEFFRNRLITQVSLRSLAFVDRYR